MPRKKHRHRADGEHFSLDIPFNRTLLRPKRPADAPHVHPLNVAGLISKVFAPDSIFGRDNSILEIVENVLEPFRGA